MKHKNEQRGAYKLIGGQSWQIMDVPVDVAWDALTNLTGYKNFIPLVTESDIKHRAGEEADLAIRQEWGPIDVRYVLQTTLEADRRSMVFRVDHSQAHDIRAGWGFMRVRPYKVPTRQIKRWCPLARSSTSATVSSCRSFARQFGRTCFGSRSTSNGTSRPKSPHFAQTIFRTASSTSASSGRCTVER